MERWIDVKTRTHFGDRPTIPLLIIQSNFGEELQVEAGLPSFMHRQRGHIGGKQLLRDTHLAFYRPGTVLKAGFLPPTNNTAQTLCIIQWISVQCNSLHIKPQNVTWGWITLHLCLPFQHLAVCCPEPEPGRPLRRHSARCNTRFVRWSTAMKANNFN